MDKKKQAEKAGGILLTIVLVMLGLFLIGILLQLFTAGAIWPWLSSNSETFRNYALIIGGGYGIYIAMKRADAHDRQAKASFDQNELTIKTLENDLFSRSIEQLSSTSVTTRNAGINSLHSLAINERKKYAQLVADTLGSYIREKTSATFMEEQENDNVLNAVHTLFKIISVKESHIYESINLQKSELRNIDVFGYNLTQGISLDGVKFSGCGFAGRVGLPELINNSQFFNCFFSGYLSALSTSFKHSTFVNVIFDSFDLSSIYFSDCKFLGCQFNDCWGLDLNTFKKCEGLNSVKINDMSLEDYFKNS